MKSIKLNLKQNPYNIYIENNSLAELTPCIEQIKNISKIAIITNDVIQSLYLEHLKNTLDPAYKTEVFIVPDGEKNKSLKQVEEIYSWMIANKFDRNALIVAFGGGVIGDLAGFVAATYLRGIRFVQIPTTLLAQVDSSIGGKVGVNHQLGKNLIGAFHQPHFVFSYIQFLNTLTHEDYMCGMGEVVKYGLIGDKILFEFLDSNFDRLSPDDAIINEHLVRVSSQLKANIVEQDEKEMGIRATLNFGHTFGHALEKYFNYQNLKHGQAVLQSMDFLQPDFSDKIIKFIDKFAIQLPQKLTNSSISELINLMQHDKKVKNEKVNFILIRNIGEVFKAEINNENIIREAFKKLN